MRLSLSKLPRPLGVLLFSSFLAFQAGAASLPAGVTEAASIEGITEYRLANGLRVLLVPDESKPSTTVNMTYLVGSRNENYGQTGMAHLLEHMLFKGTSTTRNAMGEFSRRGLQANGSTSSDRTNYFASFAANPETLKWYLGWQADAMVNSLIAKEDLDSEMTVVRNEMESGENNPFRILMQKMQSAAYQWHSYGKNTIGARSDVENVDIAQLRAFYHEYYQPDNAVLIVAGKFDPQTTLADIEATLGKLPKPDRKLPPEYTVEPAQDGERSVTLRRTGGTPLVAAMYHIPAGASADFVPFDLATTILADTPSGRLYHALVPTKLASGVFGFTMENLDPGLAMFAAQLTPGKDLDAAMTALTGTLESLDKKPFTQQELDRARSKWLTSWEQTYSDPEQVGVALSEAIAAGDWRLFFLQRDRARQATLAEVQKAATTYLVQSNRIEGRYIPTEKPVRAPQTQRVDLTAVFKDYKGDPDFKAASAFDPSPANIDMLTKRTTLDLPNGPVKLALLPKATRGSRVQAQMLIQFGNEKDLLGQRVNSSAAADLLLRGTDKLTRQDIQDRLDKLQAELGFSGGGTTLKVAMSTKGENLPELTALALEIIRNASFPKEQVEEYQRQLETSIQNAMTEPSALASRTLAPPRQSVACRRPALRADVRGVAGRRARAESRGTGQVPREVLRRGRHRVLGGGRFRAGSGGKIAARGTCRLEEGAGLYPRAKPVSRRAGQAVRHQYAGQGQRVLSVAHAAEAAGHGRGLCGAVSGQLSVRRVGNVAAVEPGARNRRSVVQRAQLAVGVVVRTCRKLEHLCDLRAAESRAPREGNQ